LSTVRFISHRVAVMYLGMIVEQGDAAELFRAPRHPYAIGLLSSVLLPHPHLLAASEMSLAGEIPSPIDLPPGCFLASRCPLVVDRCRAAMPPLEAVGDAHFVHCFRHAEAAALSRDPDNFALFQSEALRILGRRADTETTSKELPACDN
jgi:oligopeptide/dipeptide ABC transporter ATP-binding protein